MPTVNLTNGDDVFGDNEDNSGNDNVYGLDGNDIIDGGAGNDNLRGGAGEDLLIGGEGNDQLDGGADADRMEGGNGNDTYVVDNTEDGVIEFDGGGIDTVRSFVVSYALTSNVERLVLFGAAENGSGNGLDNTITGNELANSLRGLGGNDVITGGAGDDIVSGDAGNDKLNGGDGVDLVTYKFDTAGVTVDLSLTSAQNTGGSGIDILVGFENIEGSQFDDTLRGSSGANRISALGGNDTLQGRGGNDELEGGIGADTFVFDSVATNGVDTIRNFVSGTDQLRFASSDGYDVSATLTFGAAAVGAGAQFVYDTIANALSYDSNGDVAGGATLLASFVNGDVLTAGDILII